MNKNVSYSSTAIKFGLITALALIIYSTIINVADLYTMQSLSYFGLVIYIVGIILAIRAYKTENDGFMSYGQGLGIGVMVVGVAGLLATIFTYIYMTFIDTTLTGKYLDNARIQMENSGNSEDQIDAAMQVTEKFMTPGAMAGMSLVMALVLGFILSLIISAIFKNPREQVLDT